MPPRTPVPKVTPPAVRAPGTEQQARCRRSQVGEVPRPPLENWPRSEGSSPTSGAESPEKHLRDLGDTLKGPGTSSSHLAPVASSVAHTSGVANARRKRRGPRPSQLSSGCVPTRRSGALRTERIVAGSRAWLQRTWGRRCKWLAPMSPDVDSWPLQARSCCSPIGKDSVSSRAPRRRTTPPASAAGTPRR